MISPLTSPVSAVCTRQFLSCPSQPFLSGTRSCPCTSTRSILLSVLLQANLLSTLASVSTPCEELWERCLSWCSFKLFLLHFASELEAQHTSKLAFRDLDCALLEIRGSRLEWMKIYPTLVLCRHGPPNRQLNISTNSSLSLCNYLVP